VSRAEVSDVLVAGELFVDLILSGLSAFPEPGREVFAEKFARDIGGGTSITACGLAALEVDCGVFGVVGRENGDYVIGRLAERGVATSQIQFHPTETTAFTVVATMPEDRAFLSYEGANRALDDAFADALKSGKRLSRRHVHLAFAPSFTRGFDIIDAIHAANCTVSLDVGWREDWLSDTRAFEMIRQVDLFFPNLAEASRLTGEQEPARILRTFRSKGARRVALKLGASGSAFCENGPVTFAAGFPAQPIDPTGAGDSFDAGFVEAWLAGREPGVCLARANICGALSTEAFGGIAGFPTLARLEQEAERKNA
jgi:ribokinase